MLNVIASSFTIYAFEAMKAEQEKEEEVRFIFFLMISTPPNWIDKWAFYDKR